MLLSVFCKKGFCLPKNQFVVSSLVVHRRSCSLLQQRSLASSCKPFIHNSFNTRTSSWAFFSTSIDYSSFEIPDSNYAVTMPEPPYTHGSIDSFPSFHLTDLGEEIAQEEERRHAAQDLNRKLQVAYNKAKEAIDTNMSNELQEELMASFAALLKPVDGDTSASLIQANRHSRLAGLSYRLEDFARLSAFRHFLQTAELWTLPEDLPLTDEEYLAGACMSLCQDLARYGLGRATVRDAASVQAAKALVAQILDFLVQIDFRNGPLRRKYDGVKYSLNALERLLYELAVTDSNQSPEEPKAKKAKTDDSSNETLPHLLAIKQRMDHRDELREKLIKKCRDGQKAAKQAIFALHRGDRKRAETLMGQCETCIKELIPTVEEEPPLRSGSFANVLEEYVEAKLFASWLEGEEEASGKILEPKDFLVMKLTPDEYLGGLCDLTGEIGRYAVQRGTLRDTAGVRLCLHSNQKILSAIQSMPVFPSGIGKKMDQLRRSIEKLERILYELSLSEAAGGRPVQTEMESTEQQNDE